MTLFDLPVEHETKIVPRWENWHPAFEVLRGEPGRWWIISPFITTVPQRVDFQSACVLTTLDARKLATDATSLEALRALQARGAEVRVLDALHAKVYLKRCAAGHAVGFIGSANLTVRADRYNKEVMSGPHDLDSGFLRQLDEHWARAVPLTPDLVDTVKRDAARLRENIQAKGQVEEDVMVFTVDTRIFRGGFTLTEERVGVPPKDRTKGLRAARVDYVGAEARRVGGELVARTLKQARHGKHGKVAVLPGQGRLYAVPLADAEHFRAILRELDANLRTRMCEECAQQAEAWKADFLRRLEKATQAYTKAPTDRLREVRVVAGREFDACLTRQEVTVAYSAYLPMKAPSGNASPGHQAIYQALRENRPLEGLLDEAEDV